MSTQEQEREGKDNKAPSSPPQEVDGLAGQGDFKVQKSELDIIQDFKLQKDSESENNHPEEDKNGAKDHQENEAKEGTDSAAKEKGSKKKPRPARSNEKPKRRADEQTNENPQEEPKKEEGENSDGACEDSNEEMAREASRRMSLQEAYVNRFHPELKLQSHRKSSGRAEQVTPSSKSKLPRSCKKTCGGHRSEHCKEQKAQTSERHQIQGHSLHPPLGHCPNNEANTQTCGQALHLPPPPHCPPQFQNYCPPQHCPPQFQNPCFANPQMNCPPPYLSNCPPQFRNSCPPQALNNCPPQFQQSNCPPQYQSNCPPQYQNNCPPQYQNNCPPPQQNNCPPPPQQNNCPPQLQNLYTPQFQQHCPPQFQNLCHPQFQNHCPPQFQNPCPPQFQQHCPPQHQQKRCPSRSKQQCPSEFSQPLPKFQNPYPSQLQQSCPPQLQQNIQPDLQTRCSPQFQNNYPSNLQINLSTQPQLSYPPHLQPPTNFNRHTHPHPQQPKPFAPAPNANHAPQGHQNLCSSQPVPQIPDFSLLQFPCNANQQSFHQPPPQCHFTQDTREAKAARKRQAAKEAREQVRQSRIARGLRVDVLPPSPELRRLRDYSGLRITDKELRGLAERYFDNFDFDCSGSIGFGELIYLLYDLQVRFGLSEMTPSRVHRLMNIFDSDLDGQLQREELYQLFRRLI